MNKKGFTLIELLAVIAILGLIIVITIPIVTDTLKEGTQKAFKTDVSTLLATIELKMKSDETFVATNVDETNLNNLLGLRTDNYSKLSVILKNNKPYILLIGKNKWDGLVATGTFDNIIIQDKGSPITDGMVLYLDASNKSSYSGSGNTWTDLSTNAFTGTLNNGTVFQTSNRNSMQFDGIDDNVQIPGTFDYNLINSYTISAWIYPTSSSVLEGFGRTIFSSSNPGNYMIWLLTNGLNVRHYAFSTSTSYYMQTTTNPLTLNAWNYVTVTAMKDINDGTLNIYVNGNLVLVGASSNSGNTFTAFTVGDLRPSRLLNFQGNINDVLLYHRILTDAEIKHNYESTKVKYGL